MRIIGGRDYYDGAGMGVDPSITFLRTRPEEIHDGPIMVPSPVSVRDSRWHARGDRAEPHLMFFKVFVAGELYPGTMLTWQDPKTYLTQKVFHYEPEAAIALINPETYRYGWRKRDSIEVIREHFSKSGEGPWTQWMIDNGFVTAVADYDERATSDRATQRTVANADNLKDYQAYKALDPATAHMRISNWVGGVLPTAKPLVEISDTSRLLKAGFDKKLSFRKAPTKER